MTTDIDTSTTTSAEEVGAGLLRPVRMTRTSLFTAPPVEEGPTEDVRASGAVPRRVEAPTTPDSAAYKQAGNAVCVGAVQVAFSMLPGGTPKPAILESSAPDSPAPLLLQPPVR